VELEDVIKLLKFWRVFKNLKNFKSGGLRGMFKGVAMLFALGFSAISYLFFGDIGVEALELTPQDEPVLEACLANHKRLNMSFEGRISNAAGCGCTAKMVTASVEQEHFNLWAQAHALMLHNYQEAWGVTTETQQKQFEKNKMTMFSALQKKSDIAPKLYSEMVEKLHEIDEICDSESTYDEAAIVKIAALRPIGYQVQFANQAIETSQAGEVVGIQLRGARATIKTASK